MQADAEYLAVARITRPRGNRGEVVAENLAGGLRCFFPGTAVRVAGPQRPECIMHLDRAWEHNGRLVLKFAGVDTIADAERLRLAEVRADRKALGPLQAGEYFLADLVGCTMVDAGSGREIGVVADVYDPPGEVLLLSVRDGRSKELLVPFASEICCEVDVGSKRIAVRLPEGLEDLKA